MVLDVVFVVFPVEFVVFEEVLLVVVLTATNKSVGLGTTLAIIFNLAVSGVIQSLCTSPPVPPEF